MDKTDIILDEPLQSNKIDKLGADLCKAQAEIKGVKANSVNPHFSSNYADIFAVIETAISVLAKNGLSFTQGSDFIDNHFFVTTRLIHKSGQWIESKLMMPIKDRQGKVTPHSVGSAMTYGRRYGLSAMIGIGQYDDDGNVGSLKTNKMEDF